MKTTYLTDALLNEWLRNTNLAAIAPYISLLTAVSDKEAGTVTEASYTGYARVAATFGAPGAGGGGRQCTNSSAVTFGQNTGSSQDMIAFGVHDASTAGNCLAIGFLSALSPIVATAATSDTLTAPAHGMANTQKVRIERVPGTTLPTGLSENTEYFVTNSATDTFTLSLTSGGSTIDITASGACLVLPYTPVTVSASATPEFAISALVLQDD